MNLEDLRIGEFYIYETGNTVWTIEQCIILNEYICCKTVKVLNGSWDIDACCPADEFCKRCRPMTNLEKMKYL